MSIRALRPVCFVALALFISASCGGKIGGPKVGGDNDAGLLGGDDASAGDDSSTVANDDSGGDDTTGCPGSSTLVSLGSTCNWTGVCSVNLDACGDGQGTETDCECEDFAVTLPPGEGIACAGGDDESDDSTTTPPSEGCNLGAPCSEEGSTCTNSGAGPCGSDQQLLCQNGVYVADGFPCSEMGPSCGMGGTGPDACNETCTCQSGNMVCTGNCPDAGPGSP
jgi:hypothetical protein